MLQTGVHLLPLLLVLLVHLGTSHAAKCPAGLPNDTFVESPTMGCVFAESDETQRYDTYDKALGRCKEMLGDNAITDLAYWWSGLRDDDDDGVWAWESSGTIPANGYTHWHPAAVPEHSSFNCMQFLSATDYDAQWMTFLCIDDYINTHPLCQL